MEEKKETIGEKIGSEIGKEVGGSIEREIKNHFQKESDKEHKKKKEKTPGMRRVGYVFAILFTVLFLWIVNNVDNWGWQFITDEWNEVVDILLLSIYLSIIVYVLFIITDTKFFYYIGKLVTDGFSIYVGIRMYQVFPFDFNYLFGGWGWLNNVFPWIIIIGIVVAGIMIVVRTVRLFLGKEIYD